MSSPSRKRHLSPRQIRQLAKALQITYADAAALVSTDREKALAILASVTASKG